MQQSKRFTAVFALPTFGAFCAPLPAQDLIGYTEFRTNLPGGRHANVRTMRAALVKAEGAQRVVLCGSAPR